MGPVRATVGRVVEQSLQELDTKILKWLNTQQYPNTCGGSTEHRRHIAHLSDALSPGMAKTEWAMPFFDLPHHTLPYAFKHN